LLDNLRAFQSDNDGLAVLRAELHLAAIVALGANFGAWLSRHSRVDKAVITMGT
jgi:hypothetical protein